MTFNLKDTLIHILPPTFDEINAFLEDDDQLEFLLFEADPIITRCIVDYEYKFEQEKLNKLIFNADDYNNHKCRRCGFGGIRIYPFDVKDEKN